MLSIILIASVVLVATNIIIATVYLRRKNHPQESQGSGEGLQLILKQLNELSRTVDTKISENTKEMAGALRQQFGESQRLVRDITTEITQIKEIGKQSLSVQDQLRELQDILKNPKQRGVLGEYYLETLLRNVMPPKQYEMQHRFKNGIVVDAVVKVKDKLIPVDSKFSLENYNKMVETRDETARAVLEKEFVNDLKARIQETAKYVRPEEGTMDFAFMFIPHEAIYYDLLVNKIGATADETDNLIQRAASKYKVIIVSPTSFLAYLTTVLQGLKAMQIEETAKDIVKHVGELGTHLKKYEEYNTKLGVSLRTVVNHYDSAGKEWRKVDKDVLRIAGEAPGLEVPALEKPDME